MSAAGWVLRGVGGGGWRATGLRAIGWYQRWISPWKGFSCPHRAVHGGASCSGHIAALMRDDALGLGEVWQGSAERFRACHQAAAFLELQGGGRPRMKCYVIPCCFPL